MRKAVLYFSGSTIGNNNNKKSHLSRMNLMDRTAMLQAQGLKIGSIAGQEVTA